MPKNNKTSRVSAGPFWLQWREDRRVWEIAWYDAGGHGRTRRVRRIATGCTDRGSAKGPPEDAVRALFDHHAAAARPSSSPKDALIEELLANWLEEIQDTNEDPVRAANCVSHLLRFFERERTKGRLIGGPRASDIDRQLCRRYREWRGKQPGRLRKTISGATIDRELAALRAALNMAEEDKVIERAPKVFSVPANQKSTPRDVVYSPEDVARLLNAAARLPERRHVLHFIIIALSTHCRPDALLELYVEEQVSNGVIDFLRPGESQTRKKRSKVRIAPTLQPWIDQLSGKAVEARSVKFSGDEACLIMKQCSSIKTAFAACLREAGLVDPVLDAEGKPLFKVVKKSSGKSVTTQVVRLRGSPIALKHTIATYLHAMGIAESQIEVAAGHDGMGTNKKNYRHIRPEYLTDFCRGIEAFWSEVAKYTKVHLLPQRYPKLTIEEAQQLRRK